VIPNQNSTQDEFLKMFDSLVDQKSPLVMTKSHQGIILSQEVKAVVVDKHRVVCEVGDPRICAALEGCIHLHCQLFSRPVKARVMDLSVSKGMFSLSEFSYLQRGWMERLHERVQPKDPTYVSMRYRGLGIRSSLSDISINGAGLLLGKSEDYEIKFEINSSVVIDFHINPAFRWRKLGGAIQYQQSATSSLLRLGIRLYPKEEQARHLDRYIADRKAEIMEDLDQTYLTASIPSRIEYQYF
jgi:hypothetical protein